MRKFANELVSLVPDAILANSSAAVSALLEATRTVPIVFAAVADPVGASYVESLSRPGGNATGFTVFEYGISAKWLELLKELAPDLTRAAVVRDPAIAAGIGQFAAIQTVAPSFGVELSAVNVRDKSEIERAITAFVRRANGGLIITGGSSVTPHRDLIIELAAQLRLPAVYPFRYYVAGGGLMSYGPIRAISSDAQPGYVDRILKGEKPADLPVQAPTKYETGDQPENGEGAWTDRAAVAACPRRRGDRVSQTILSAFVQVFGRRHRSHPRAAATGVRKAPRQEIAGSGHWRCRGCYGDLAAGFGLMRLDRIGWRDRFSAKPV